MLISCSKPGFREFFTSLQDASEQSSKLRTNQKHEDLMVEMKSALNAYVEETTNFTKEDKKIELKVRTGRKPLNCGNNDQFGDGRPDCFEMPEE